MKMTEDAPTQPRTPQSTTPTPQPVPVKPQTPELKERVSDHDRTTVSLLVGMPKWTIDQVLAVVREYAPFPYTQLEEFLYAFDFEQRVRSKMANYIQLLKESGVRDDKRLTIYTNPLSTQKKAPVTPVATTSVSTSTSSSQTPTPNAMKQKITQTPTPTPQPTQSSQKESTRPAPHDPQKESVDVDPVHSMTMMPRSSIMSEQEIALHLQRANFYKIVRDMSVYAKSMTVAVDFGDGEMFQLVI